MDDNGHLKAYGMSPGKVIPRDYATTVYTRKATGFITRNSRRKAPFYLTIAPFAPHAEGDSPGPLGCRCTGNNPRAAPQDEGHFDGLPLPKTPAYDEQDVSDKPLLTQALPPIPPSIEQEIAAGYRARLESLLSVDRMIKKVVETLKKTHRLNNTLIVFTSDNGWLYGEHRWRVGKVLPYEESIKVPLYMRGPGVQKGALRSDMVANVDLAPTLLDFAGGTAHRPEDGVSLRPLLAADRPDTNRAILLEGHYNQAGELGGNDRIVFAGVRTPDYTYVSWETGEEELYDLRNDPYELQSQHNNPAYAAVKASLRQTLVQLSACAGASCHVGT
jgi:arylsulfatase A-like enzyme